jgi:hypothetical protein
MDVSGDQIRKSRVQARTQNLNRVFKGPELSIVAELKELAAEFDLMFAARP